MHSAFEELFFRSMKNDWKDFGDFMTSFWDSVLRSLSSALSTWIIGDLQKQLSVGVQSFTGAGGGAGGLLSGIKSFFGFAHGGVITKPTLFPMANGGMGIAGEAGRDEAILPLTRIGADLGVKSTGMEEKEIKVEFNIINQTGIEVTGEVENITKTPDRIIGELVLRRKVKSRKFRDAMGV
jgi:phage-related minor tail protein